MDFFFKNRNFSNIKIDTGKYVCWAKLKMFTM